LETSACGAARARGKSEARAWLGRQAPRAGASTDLRAQAYELRFVYDSAFKVISKSYRHYLLQETVMMREQCHIKAFFKEAQFSGDETNVALRVHFFLYKTCHIDITYAICSL
jgi:hypothetical protein